VVRRIFEPKREEVTSGWRKLHKEELHYLYSSLNIIRMNKWRDIIWTGHVACIGETISLYMFSVGKSGHWQAIFLDERIILKSILKN
jgi:hypothetical protein